FHRRCGQIPPRGARSRRAPLQACVPGRSSGVHVASVTGSLYFSPKFASGCTRSPSRNARPAATTIIRFQGGSMAVDIAQLLAFGVKNNASDLHLSAGVPPMIRVDGDMRKINMPALEHNDVHDMVYDIM